MFSNSTPIYNYLMRNDLHTNHLRGYTNDGKKRKIDYITEAKLIMKIVRIPVPSESRSDDDENISKSEEFVSGLEQ